MAPFNQGNKMKTTKKEKISGYSILIFASFLALFPLFWTFSTSIKNRIDTYTLPPKFFDFTPTFKNYSSLFAIDAFPKIYLNTIFVTVMSTLIVLAIGSLSAYAIARRSRFRGRSSLEALMIAVRALPGIVLLLPLYRLSSFFGLYDSLWALVFIYAGFNLPFAIWLLTSFFRQIPVEIEEAARVDGASNTRMFVKILLPLAMPGIMATGVFIALLSWNEFLIPVIMAGEESKTLPVFVAGFISNRTLDWGPMAAAATIALIPIVIFTIFIQKYLVAGLSSGAVKE
jgi:ABC-type glycerol-3-phosphate transport system permease component